MTQKWAKDRDSHFTGKQAWEDAQSPYETGSTN